MLSPHHKLERIDRSRSEENSYNLPTPFLTQRALNSILILLNFFDSVYTTLLLWIQICHNGLFKF